MTLLTTADLAFVERLIRESRTWAFVDWMAVPVVGAMVDRHPEPTAHARPLGAAVGWVLREVGKTRPRLVSDWLLQRASRASGVTMREGREVLARVATTSASSPNEDPRARSRREPQP